MITEYINHTRNRSYMSGIERDKIRIKQNAEIFTPTKSVIRKLDDLEKYHSDIFNDTKKKDFRSHMWRWAISIRSSNTKK